MKSKFFPASLALLCLMVSACAVGTREAPDGSSSADSAAASDRGTGPGEGGAADVSGADGPVPDASTADTLTTDLTKPDAPCATACKGKCPGAVNGCGGTCKTNSCSGCCNGAQCRMGTFDTACGKAGQACADCTGKSGQCGKGVCKAGACSGTSKPEGAACTGGFCHKGACCKGCWSGSACHPGTTSKLCGAKGVKCSLCSDSKVCTTDQCVSGACKYTLKAAGTNCGGGTCNLGYCCGGCWAGTKCVPGNTSSACGKSGATCKPCVSNDPCKVASCATATCVTKTMADLTPCPGGQCISGGCCTGCGPIVLTTLNEAHTGALGGIGGADALCANQAKATGHKGVYKAFLSAAGRDVKDLVKPCCATKFPVLNTKAEVLYTSWNQIFTTSKWVTNLYLYSFDGKKVDEGTGAVPDWVDADGWHGSLPGGTVDAAFTCNNWTSPADTISGANGELDFGELVKQEKATCNKTLAVVCVKIPQ